MSMDDRMKAYKRKLHDASQKLQDTVTCADCHHWRNTLDPFKNRVEAQTYFLHAAGCWECREVLGIMLRRYLTYQRTHEQNKKNFVSVRAINWLIALFCDMKWVDAAPDKVPTSQTFPPPKGPRRDPFFGY